MSKMNLFKDFTTDVNLETPDFKNRKEVHDWKNYVPKELIKDWLELTNRERKIIYTMAEIQANDEDWD